MSQDSAWRGVPLTQMYGAETPWGAPEFPLVRPSSEHTVLYEVPKDRELNEGPPAPVVGEDVWDRLHVRLPCSNQDLYSMEDESDEPNPKKHWTLIENALSKPIRNSQELIDAILSYNSDFKDKWKFALLDNLFNKCLEEQETKFFFDVTLPAIVKLALALPKLIRAPIPLLSQGKSHSISLSQQQIASLLANAFFCTFPRRNFTKKKSEYSSYPCINFSRLYETTTSKFVLEKMKCILYYFKRVTTTVPTGVVTFCRRSVQTFPAWAASKKPIGTLPVHADSQGLIERADGLIQLDFAHKMIGGIVLGHGCVQEEIRFIICPELIACMLFTEEMKPNEAVLIIGAERYSEYAGYGKSFVCTGEYADSTPEDASGRRRAALLAVDALSFSRRTQQQYQREKVDRELNKAWVGFSFFTDEQSGISYPGVATGNWGCGVYRGSPYLKSLLQLMACAQAGRPMAYYTFRNEKLRNELIHIHSVLSKFNVTVGQLYTHILKFCEGTRSQDLFTYLEHTLKQEAEEISPVTTASIDTSGGTQTSEPSISDTTAGDNDAPRRKKKKARANDKTLPNKIARIDD